MTESPFKFYDLQTLYGIVEVQVETLTSLVDTNKDEDQVKFLKKELSGMKSLKTKLNKLIKSY